MVSALTPFLGFLRGRLPVGGVSAGFSSLARGVTGGGNNGLLTTPRGGLLGTTEWVRSIVHINFPRPKETKRIRVHGWNTRMKTRGGRAIIMRRILKGRFILSH